MSEWKAGDNENDSDEEVVVVRKRLTKGEKQRVDDEAEYEDEDDHGSGKKKKSPSPKSSPTKGKKTKRIPATKAGESIHARCISYLQTIESTLGFDAARVPRSIPGQGVTSDLATQPFYLASVTLHPHQMSALNFIKSRFEMNLNVILADEMGLGKTASAISFLSYLQELADPVDGKQNHAAASSSSSSSSASPNPNPSKVGPFLVVCPLTVLDNWTNELTSFSPNLILQPYHGSKPEREEIQDEIRDFIRTQPKAQRKDPDLPFHVLLTTYESVINDVEFLSKFKWRVAIIDEAHRLKNSESILAQTLMQEYDIAFKLLLTGTPVQNDLSELWSLLWFLQPDVFDNKKIFVDEFEIVSNQPPSRGLKEILSTLSSESERITLARTTMDQLHDLLRPFLLRRIKDECNLNIPPKREIILKTRLTKLQKEIYKNLLLKNYNLIGNASEKGGGGGGNTRALLNIVQSLRKCSTHPYLFPGVEPEPFEEGPHIYQASGKFILLEKVLKILKRQKKRVLLFSTSVQTLDIVQDALTYMKYTYERLDGSVRGEERYEAIQRFTKTSPNSNSAQDETFVFLLSTRAGGVGLNLTQASVVIFLDNDWNPQMDLQAQARAHRIGQTQEVLVIRLVASNTVEEIIQKRTMRKLLMTHQILAKGRFNHTTAKNDGDGADGGDDDNEASSKSKFKANVDENEQIGRSANDLKNILQYGLENLFGEEGDEEMTDDGGSSAKDMQEDEIEAILTGEKEKLAKAVAAAAKQQEEKKNEPLPMDIDDDDNKSSSAKPVVSASSPSAAAATAASARAAYNRITSLALPSLDEASASSTFMSSIDEEDPSVYVFEGTDFKAIARDSLESLDDELANSANAGSKTLQNLVAHQRATMPDEDITNGYASPDELGGSRKRKAVLQETDDERTARIAKNKEAAMKRLEATKRKRQEAETARQHALALKWAEHDYVSRGLVLDEVAEATFEKQEQDSALELENTAPGADTQSEWVQGDQQEEEKKGEESSAGASPASKAKLHFVVGDATFPFVFQREDGREGMVDCSPAASSSSDDPTSAISSAIVFVPLDASGSWGKGGLFRALDQRSQSIGAHYEVIGGMEDLSMGDVHIVTLEPTELIMNSQDDINTATSSLTVALAAILKRPKGQNYGAPSIDPVMLSLSFRKLSTYAKVHKCSVHIPRFGSNDPNIQWYGIERLINKYLVARGVDVYVYYYQRRRPQYRSPIKTQLSRSASSFSKRSMSFETAGSREVSGPEANKDKYQYAASTSTASLPKAAAASSSLRTASSRDAIVIDGEEEESRPAPVTSQLSSLSQFHDVFTSCIIYIHKPAAAASAPTITPTDDRLLTRFITAYDGEVVGEVTSKVTHIITPEAFLTPELIALKQRASQRVRVQQLSWVEQSVNCGRLDDSLKWQVTAPPK